jgi:predicted enzyme related to lactoylglutathione lyase
VVDEGILMVSTVSVMHRSRIGLVLVDHPEEAWQEALAFWAGVQGVTPTGEDEGQAEYRSLGTIGSVALESQRTGAGTAPRVHLDIETDDVAAEVARVLALGASVLEEREGYTVLRDPAGLVFCVVPVQTGADFEREALTWDE